MTTTILDYQLAVETTDVPSEEQVALWLNKAITRSNPAEVTVRVVDSDEIQALNREYREKDYATNVLSFPFEPFAADIPEALAAQMVATEQNENSDNLEEAITESVDFLGDIVICAEVVAKEAAAQKKPLQHHWAHMIVHGTLHLLGYDHINEQDAEEMEALEVKILDELGIDDPYQDQE